VLRKHGPQGLPSNASASCRNHRSSSRANVNDNPHMSSRIVIASFLGNEVSSLGGRHPRPGRWQPTIRPVSSLRIPRPRRTIGQLNPRGVCCVADKKIALVRPRLPVRVEGVTCAKVGTLLSSDH